MRAFLSHSSKDKGFVEAVAELLKPGTYELDSATFDAGLLNSQAIIDSLKRCDLFCLFLSTNSISSSYVDFETLLGIEFLAAGRIDRFLVICLDEDAFSKSAENIRFFNVVRRGITPESAARLIQGSMISVSVQRSNYSHPFIGRESDLLELEKQINDPERPPTKALFVSGNYGAGRRTLLKKFYQNQFPSVVSVFPTIRVGEFSGLEELYRLILGSLRSTLSVKELRLRIEAFSIASQDEQIRQISDLINSVHEVREGLFIVDAGGVLTDAGELQPEIGMMLDRLNDRPYPPVSFVAPRMTPLKLRRSKNDVAYLALRSLARDDATRLAARLLKGKDVAASVHELSEIVNLADGHPYNFYRILDEIDERGLASFLANPADFINWKHRQSSEYVGAIEFTRDELLILSLLTLLPSLDFQAIVDALELDASLASDALLRLTSFHVVEHTGVVFALSPPVRVAVERDRRVTMAPEARKRALKVLAETLSIRIDEGSARIELLDSAIISSIENGAESSDLVAAFLLPSHYVWLAKRNYDQRHYAESIRLANEALKAPNRLSSSGYVAACRFMCLAAARLNEQDTFQEGIRRLETIASNDWAKSNVAFLKGFNARLKGQLPQAEDYFRESYKYSPGNISTAREIAAISLARGNLDEAEKFAREALGIASKNPYVIDILISVLVKKLGRKATTNTEVNDMLELLRHAEEGERSFYDTRKAEMELLWGDNRIAKRFIEDAIRKTPTIFEPHRIHAEILLKEGNKSKALEEINWMREKVNSWDNPAERRTNYRLYLDTYANYLQEVGQFKEAKEIYGDASIFTAEERDSAIRNIEIAQGYGQAGR